MGGVEATRSVMSKEMAARDTRGTPPHPRGSRGTPPHTGGPASHPGYLELGTERRRPSRAFFTRASPQVAPDLLGKLLVRDEGDGAATVARLVETEAYQQNDPASHSYRGRTERNAVMFGRAGHLYVYFTYGMHYCMNVSCDQEGVGSAVLLRAAVIVEGRDRVRERRGQRPDRDLLRGPGRLSAGLDVDRSFDGLDLLDSASPLRFEDDGWGADPAAVVAGPRVGIRTAADKPWRFWLEGVPEVSRYARHPRAGR
ncbi:MAG: DNA-3-methyladenine glycosylase [Actinomycetota bacterium]|nr:DNA-3-methyladenine glycosylase [Actinomycetota bacterium]